MVIYNQFKRTQHIYFLEAVIMSEVVTDLSLWEIKSFDASGKLIECAHTYWAGDARDLEELLYVLYELEPKGRYWKEQLEAINFTAFTYHDYYNVGVYIDYSTNTIKVMDIALQ